MIQSSAAAFAGSTSNQQSDDFTASKTQVSQENKITTETDPNQILSELTVWMKYARHLKHLRRRETWTEICDRNRQMHLEKFPILAEEINRVYDDLVIPKKILPSMRSMQFAGNAIKQHNSRMFNCAYAPVDSIHALGEIMFLLLGGTGMGYSVQHRHITSLPAIYNSFDARYTYKVQDSIEGWGDAIKELFFAYTNKLGRKPIFDLSKIRERGAELVTSGGKAPGPEPLKKCLQSIENILKVKRQGSKLTDLEVHDAVCHMADAVYAGGIRRAALICLFDRWSDDMLKCKTGEWWNENPQRMRANNSAVLPRDTDKVNREQFLSIWKDIENSGCGEPGIYWTSDTDWGTNPCVETALRPFQFCNLVEINASSVESIDDMRERVKGAALLGTLQAAYTDFNYLRPCWKENTEMDALLGVSMTGLASKTVDRLEIDLTEMAELAVNTNVEIARRIDIKPSARVTCIKPAGTTSLTLGTSSGIHAWHDKFYFRRVRVGKQEAIYSYLLEQHPNIVENCQFNPKETAVISVPQKAAEGSLLRGEESAIQMLNRIKNVYLDWVIGGHQDGINTHNISATVSLKPEEWEEVGNWMWENRRYYNGISVLPFDGGSYVQAPFESIDELTYEKAIKNLGKIDLTRVVEAKDGTDLAHELACVGGLCEL